jgi:CTP-dependent riboflavin kinase
MIEWIGRVTAGRDLGSLRMTPDVLDLLRSETGLHAVPGTLNVRLGGPVDESLLPRYLGASAIDPAWAEATGQSGYRWVPVTIEGRFDGVAIRAVEDHYPDDLIEVVSGTHLRSELGLGDGDEIRLTVG